ncbi:MAG: ABC transporter ATP-binding protein [Candidatus Planktophila sp.]|jgi:branched-chain amino acid transport system ATP-binding protein|tara:strand:+ start:6740 stop:7447 length:708 start_codon:yes stop_codon:yes gene_type:complete
MLKVHNLVVDHGAIRALNGVSFTVETGKLSAVIGANGAGKSTLLRTLSGLNKATEGSAMWEDHNLLHGKPESHVRQGVSHVSEGKSVVAELTVEENLELGALWRRNKKESLETKKEVVELFPRLGERLEQRADTLSGGERQMLAIGRALMARPQLLLLDEPSLGLAPLVIEQIFQTIRGIVDSMKVTVVLVEQNAMGALKIADTGVVLNLGHIAATGSAADLIADPAVRAAYLGY